MASKTAAQLVTQVQDAIGNRFEGTIGSRNLQDVILDAINETIFTICSEHKTRTFSRNATVSLTTSNYRYAVPTTDEDSNTIRVADILSARILKSGETTPWKLVQLNSRRKDRIAPLTLSTYKTRPIYYCHFANNLEFHPWPDGNYTVYLRVLIWPTKLVIDQTHPFPEQWDDVIRNGATYITFRNLQLNDDATYWKNEFTELLNKVIDKEREDTDFEPSSNPDGYRPVRGVNDPALNAFVRRWPR